jgi:hypothetical protein
VTRIKKKLFSNNPTFFLLSLEEQTNFETLNMQVEWATFALGAFTQVHVRRVYNTITGEIVGKP